jgi:hypothetical protein
MVCAISCHKLLKTTPKSACLAVWLLACGLSATEPTYPSPVEAGQMAEPRNREASGLAGSRRADALLWTHNDSGGEPVLFALGADGAKRGQLRLDGIAAVDWEDLASFTLDGRSWLLVADTGDNFARRESVVLHVIEEPDPTTLAPAGELGVRPAYSIPFIYEDGARDCEAVAVDPVERAVWLLTKRDVPARLYRLPLQPASVDMPAAARFVGFVRHLPQPDFMQKLVQTPTSALRGMPTAMDFTPDGTAAAVLIYGNLLLFPRAAGESWTDALTRKPVHLPDHGLSQAEAVCFSADGRHLFVCSERTGLLLRYDLP